MTIANAEKRAAAYGKAEKASLHQFDADVKELRAQFAEQLRSLETRTETQVALLAELYEFFKRRADVEYDHGRHIAKMGKQLMHKARAHKEKREAYTAHSMFDVWQSVVDDSVHEAAAHERLGDFYTSHVLLHIQQRQEHLTRMSKKCREIGASSHEEMSRVLTELHTAMKTYHLFYAECAVVNAKMHIAEQTKTKFEANTPSKVPNSRKYRQLCKAWNKRSAKHEEHKVRAMRARNEYLLCVDAANAALAQYFASDLPDLIDCGDVGQQHWLAHLTTTIVTARKTLCTNRMASLADLDGLQHNFDGALDRQRFMSSNHAVFALPRRFEFKAHHSDTTSHVQSHSHIEEELVQRLWQIQQRVDDLRQESDELYTSLTNVQTAIMHAQCLPSYDDAANNNCASTPNGNVARSAPSTPSVGVVVTPLGTPTQHTGGKALGTPTQHEDKRRQRELDEQETSRRKAKLVSLEDEYLVKFRAYVIKANLIRRLQARGHQLRRALDGRQPHVGVSSSSAVHDTSISPSAPSSLPTTVKRRIGGHTAMGRPKLFGGCIDEYTEVMGDDIPVIVTSSVRMLSTFALHHQGVFRVSGSQLEIQAFKESFEMGDDPLTSDPRIETSYVNSVAGVLKLYLRQLRQPLFPTVMFTQFVECARLTDRDEFITEMRRLTTLLPRAVLLTMRFLFAFLNHLGEFADENMMDPYNLAICFGPTVMPIPAGNDQVYYHNHVSDLVRNVITWHAAIFPQNMPGTNHTAMAQEALSETTDTALPQMTIGETTADDDDPTDVDCDSVDGAPDNTSCTAVVDELANGHAEHHYELTQMTSPMRSPGILRQMKSAPHATTPHEYAQPLRAVGSHSEPPYVDESDDEGDAPHAQHSPLIRSMHAQLSSPGQQLWMPYTTATTASALRSTSPPNPSETDDGLKTMQSELKAVLTALEEFNVHRPNGAPDLVQNLPQQADLTLQSSTSSSSHHASPIADVGADSSSLSAAARLHVRPYNTATTHSLGAASRKHVIGPSPMPKPHMPWHRTNVLSTAQSATTTGQSVASSNSSQYEERIV